MTERASKFIKLDLSEYNDGERGRIKSEPRLLDVMQIFEDIKSAVRQRLATTTMPSMVAAVTTPAKGIPVKPGEIEHALAQGKVTAGVQPYRKTSSPDIKATNPRLAEMHGCEALMKIIENAETLRRAGETVKTADRIPGLTSQIDLAVLENAGLLILIINELRDQIGLTPIPIAFNCSQDLVNRTDFAGDILHVLDEGNVPHEFCTVEILENIRDLAEGQIAQFKQLSEAGVHIAIDDFDQRVNDEGAKDKVLQKLKEAEVSIFRLKTDGETVRTITTASGYAKCEEIIQIAIEAKVASIVFEGGYHNLTTIGIEHIKRLEKKYGDRIEFLVEGTVVDT